MYDPQYDALQPEYTAEDAAQDKADRDNDDTWWRNPPPQRRAKPVFGAEREPMVQKPLFIGGDDLPGQQYLIDPFTSQE